jgi:hypothetical protein
MVTFLQVLRFKLCILTSAMRGAKFLPISFSLTIIIIVIIIIIWLYSPIQTLAFPFGVSYQ